MVRDLVRSLDRMEWVIISTGMFTGFLFEPSFGVVDRAQNTVHALGSWATAVTVTTPKGNSALTAEFAYLTCFLGRRWARFPWPAF
jgi:hypothetical protein